MKTYQSKARITGGKIKKIDGILQVEGKVMCVVTFEDGSSKQVDYLLIGNARAEVGMYWIDHGSDTLINQCQAIDATQFEAQYEEAK